MPSLTAAVVAVGAQGWVHLHGYRQLDGLRVTAVADVDRVRANVAAATCGARAYTDYEELLAVEEVDVLSVCTPPAMHERIVLAAAAAGVRAVHCEKPMALSFGAARRMHERAAAAGMLLTINHQRRWDPMYRTAQAAVTAGEIGTITSCEGYCANLFDWGSHLVDLILFFCRDDRPERIFGQIEVAERRHVYGALIETASVTFLHWADGRNASVFTGRGPGRLTTSGSNALVINGTEGRLEITSKQAILQRFDGSRRVIPETVQDKYRIELNDVDPAIVQGTALAIADLVDCLRHDRRPVLDSRHGLAAAEIIFATYASSASRAPVELPFTADDNALFSGLDLGFWSPVGESYGTS